MVRNEILVIAWSTHDAVVIAAQVVRATRDDENFVTHHFPRRSEHRDGHGSCDA